MSFVKDELGQVVPAISKNLFLKKDQKNLNNMKSLYPSSRAMKGREASDERAEEPVEERELSVQRDCLRQELDQVLKGIREAEGGKKKDDGQLK